MRHNVSTKKLSRDVDHRQALEKNLATQFLENGKLVTTLVKAKWIRPYVEKLITRAKNTKSDDKVAKFNTVRYLKAKLTTEKSIKKTVEELAPKFKDIKGGYTRIVKLPSRKGDNAPLARIELVSVKGTKHDSKK